MKEKCGRKNRKVIAFFDNGKNMIFESIKITAEYFGVSSAFICNAIKDGKKKGSVCFDELFEGL